METIKYNNSNTKKLLAIVMLAGIIIYGFFLKDNLQQTERILVAYSMLTLAGFVIVVRGYFYIFSGKRTVKGRKAYLFGSAVILFGFLKILSLYNLI
ncbi:MAG: hypothetical protein ACXWEY_13560 [Bacteroidia bacterium]